MTSVVSVRPRSRAIFGSRRATSTAPDSSFNSGASSFGLFRCTDRDKAPAREVVTAKLLGDPAPDRKMPDEPRDPIRDRVRSDSPIIRSPIYLTFREMRAAYGDPK